MLLTALLQLQKHGISESGLNFRSSARLVRRLRLQQPFPGRTWTTWTCTSQRRTYQSLTREQAQTQAQAQEEIQAATANEERFWILFMGRDEFSCLVLQQLYEAKDVWQEIVIATLPDVHVGRGGSVLSISPLKSLGQKLDIPVWTIPKVKKEFRTWELPPPFALQPSSPAAPTSLSLSPPPTHLLITASFGRILSPRMLSSFLPGRRLNVHPSALPAYRGPAPLQWTICNGEKKTGVCVIEMLKMKEGIDAGGVWGRDTVDVPPDATFETLRDRLAVLGGRLLVDVLRDMIRGKATMHPQEPTTSSTPKAPFISARDALVDFETMTAQDVYRRFRGISHQKPLYTYAPDGKPLQLVELRPFDPVSLDSSSSSSSSSSPSSSSSSSSSPSDQPQNPPTTHNPSQTNPPGHTTFNKQVKALLVQCDKGTVLSVTHVKPEGKGVRPAGEWWTGLRSVKRGEGGRGVLLGGGGGGGGGRGGDV